jgi:hypothetical protein
MTRRTRYLSELCTVADMVTAGASPIAVAVYLGELALAFPMVAATVAETIRRAALPGSYAEAVAAALA